MVFLVANVFFLGKYTPEMARFSTYAFCAHKRPYGMSRADCDAYAE